MDDVNDADSIEGRQRGLRLRIDERPEILGQLVGLAVREQHATARRAWRIARIAGRWLNVKQAAPDAGADGKEKEAGESGVDVADERADDCAEPIRVTLLQRANLGRGGISAQWIQHRFAQIPGSLLDLAAPLPRCRLVGWGQEALRVDQRRDQPRVARKLVQQALFVGLQLTYVAECLGGVGTPYEGVVAARAGHKRAAALEIADQRRDRFLNAIDLARIELLGKEHLLLPGIGGRKKPPPLFLPRLLSPAR